MDEDCISSMDIFFKRDVIMLGTILEEGQDADFK
jgi:hypothetical protein